MPDNTDRGFHFSDQQDKDVPAGKNHLLVIGIDKYAYIKPLKNAVTDADNLIEVLISRYEFESDQVYRLYDEAATNRGIQKNLRMLKNKVGKDDSLIVFYAGHGAYDEDFEQGFWIPANANPEDEEDFSEYIPNRQVINYLKKVDCRHLILISDSCFSGSFFDDSRSTKAGFAKEKSRWGFTSGRKEKVKDGTAGKGSPFTNHITRVLREATDSLLLSELGNKVKIATRSTTEKGQTPRIEPLAIDGHNGGEFVFHPKNFRPKNNETKDWMQATEKDTPTAYHSHYTKWKDGKHADEALWLWASKSHTKSAFRRYLKEKPRGAFFDQVLEKMEAIEDKERYEQAKRKGEAALIRFVREHPDSDYIADAKAEIARIQKLEEEQEPVSDIKIPSFPIPQMVSVPGGTFIMGSQKKGNKDAGDNERPGHKVTLSAYQIGKYPVTFEEYDTFCDATVREKPDDAGWGRGKRPVINISWEDAKAYCDWLNEASGEKGWRLPTEAEWEFAAAGGPEGYYQVGRRRHTYSSSNDLEEVGWYSQNSESQTHPVGQKRANDLGIHDMSGNVWQWCGDWYGNYPKDSQTNPTGPVSGTDRVDRGGSWFNGASDCRVAYRDFWGPDNRLSDLGFRLARTP
jgi:formylglycine-generating enzyme required for sulfatase activity